MKKPNSNLLITESPNKKIISIKKSKINKENLPLNNNILEKKKTNK